MFFVCFDYLVIYGSNSYEEAAQFAQRAKEIVIEKKLLKMRENPFSYTNEKSLLISNSLKKDGEDLIQVLDEETCFMKFAAGLEYYLANQVIQ